MEGRLIGSEGVEEDEVEDNEVVEKGGAVETEWELVSDIDCLRDEEFGGGGGGRSLVLMEGDRVV
jgi:hypothetical protein